MRGQRETFLKVDNFGQINFERYTNVVKTGRLEFRQIKMHVVLPENRNKTNDDLASNFGISRCRKVEVKLTYLL